MNLSDTESSAFRIHFRAKLKKNMKSFVPLLILQLLGFPQVAAVSLYISSFFRKKYIRQDGITEIIELPTIMYISVTVAGLALAVLLLFGISLGISNFRYLHRKPETDKILSLPVTKKQLFAADYLSGMIVYLVPGIIALAAASLILWLNPEHCLWLPHYDSSTLQVLMEYGTKGISPVELISNREFIYSFIIAAEFIPAMIMIYTFTVMIMVCCGTSFEAFTYFLLSGISLTGFSGMLKTAFEESILNKTDGYYPFAEAELLSPVGGIIRLFKNYCCFLSVDTSYYVRDFEDYIPYSYRSWGIWHILFAAVYLLAAWKMFAKRKAENTSKPFAFPWLFYTVSFFITGTVIFIMAESSFSQIYSYKFAVAMIIALIISTVIFLVMLMFRYRGIRIKKPGKQTVFLLVSCVIAASLFISVRLTCGFGMMYYIPDPEKVSSASISSDFGTEICELTDFSSIKALTGIHSKINEETKTRIINGVSHIDEMYNYISFSNSKYNLKANNRMRFCTFNVQYHLKNGELIARSLTPVNTDYSHSPLSEVYRNQIHCSVTNNENLMQETLDSDYIFCTRTEFADEISKSDYFSITSSWIEYPMEYRLTDYDKDILKELLKHAYFSDYHSTEDFFILSTDPGHSFNLIIPNEYSELYESFLNSGKKEKLEWFPGN